MLEARSYGLALRWRARSAHNIHSRVFHFLDSVITMAAAAKGRSSSTRLRGIMLQNAAVILAGGASTHFAFFYSHGAQSG